MKLLASLCTAFGLGAVANATLLPARARTRALQERQTTYPIHTFEQTIDHFPHDQRYEPHDKGTFKQRYYFEGSHYKPGGPIFLFLGGEVAIAYWDIVLQESIVQILIEQFNGLGIILETRYYGGSYPYNTTTTDQLAYLTTEQILADIQAFALKAKIPGFEGINAPHQPWILIGGSYAGALTAFAMKTYGDTLYAGIASSGVVQAYLGYPQWYAPIQKLAAQDCVTSINDIVDKMDMLVEANQTSAIQSLKEFFGLSALTDIRDFARAIAFPLGGPLAYPTNSWQEIDWDPEIGSQDFFYFCRNVTNVSPPVNNTHVDWELAKYTNNEAWTNLGNYAAYIKRVVLPTCPSGDYNSFACFGTQHPKIWAETTNTELRSFGYTLCTEFAGYQVAYPKGQKSLVSRVLQVDYTQQWCKWSYPKGKYNSIPATPDLERWNRYGGYNLTADRLLYMDGSADVWKDLTYHSDLAPPRYWSKDHPEYLINGAGHIWDIWSEDDLATEPQYIREAHLFEIRTVTKWLDGFKSWNSSQS